MNVLVHRSVGLHSEIRMGFWKLLVLFYVCCIVSLHSTDLNVRAMHGTLVVFLQNDAGFAKWEPTTERLRELLLAYRPTEPPRH